MKRILVVYPQDIDFTAAASYPTGEVVLDLYKDEPIPFQFKVDDFTNVAEKSSSNSKSFEVPGTKINNLFFNHIYDITADSEFNAHKQTKVIYKENGIDIFSGYLQLNDVINKNDNVSYEITLFSETINLKDDISNKILRDLDLEELNHNYTENDIKSSWNDNLSYTSSAVSGYRDGSTIKYPFIRYNTNTSYTANVPASSSEIVVPTPLDAFRPWINCRYLVRSILADAGYSYTSTFLDSTAFNKLYLDVPGGGPDMIGYPIIVADTPDTGAYTGSTWTTIDFDNSSANDFTSNLYNNSTDVLTAVSDSTFVLFNIQLPISVSSQGLVKIRIKTTGTGYYTNNQVIYSQTLPAGNQNININNNIFQSLILDTSETLSFEISVSTSATLGSSSSIIYSVYTDIMSINNNLIGFRGELNQWDFIKGFIDKFNLLIMADEDNPSNLIIEPYKDWVDSGDTLDWTNKIDDREIKYTTISGLANEVQFMHTEDTPEWGTIPHNYPTINKWAHYFYPDIEISDKEIEKIEVKGFSSTSISNNFGGQLAVPAIINTDTSLDYWPNKPRILYDNGVQTMSTHTFRVPPINWNAEDDYLLFSPVDIYPITSSTKSLDFGVVNYGIGGGAVLESLYNIYWSKYIDELYHKDTRIAKVKAYLTSKDISDFSFNDIIMIKNRKYRVKLIDYKQDALSTLELITIKDL
jgi:hypothetical protein